MNKELEVAYNILKEVYFNGAYASIELNHSYIENLNFNLITKIVYGVLDFDVKLDYFISKFYKKAPKKEIKLILKIGAYLKLEINSIPNFAYVNELVELTKKSKFKPYVSFVNATLKKISSSEFSLPPKKNLRQYLSIKYSKTPWLINLMLNNFDEKFVEDYLSYNLTTQTHVRVNTLKISIEEFKQKLTNLNVKFENSVLPDGLFVDYASLVRINELFGFYTPQGIPSMIVSKNAEGSLILDSCSAPGGKAVYVASLNKNSNVVACDVYEHRVALIEDYKQKMGVKNVQTKVLNAKFFNPEFENKFDCVILDVPCSGLGVINKKPDILINNDQKFLHLPTLQLEILNNNAKYVKKGGSIIYSTCTILKEENENIINEFIKNNPNFKISEVNTCGVNAVNNNGLITFYPHVSNTEGFFIGKLVRND